ncbi:hypothetical protein BWI97_08780 [Siphonobacter sp. BAB-5405]|nr:hypothetical protein BWI97_08780 [Siphonobacter sp. BAB-5405]
MKEWIRDNYHLFNGTFEDFHEAVVKECNSYMKQNPTHGRVKVTEIYTRSMLFSGKKIGWAFYVKVASRKAPAISAIYRLPFEDYRTSNESADPGSRFESTNDSQS